MKLKGKRSQLGANYDESIGCFTDNYMIQCKGGGGSTTTSMPSEEQKKIYEKQLGYAEQMEGLGPMQFFTGSTVAETSPYSEIGLQSQLGAAEQAAEVGGSAIERFQRAMAYDPLEDPNTEQYLQAITSPLTKQFYEDTLPGLGSTAVKGGAFGGDRAALLEAEAAGDYMSTMADTRAKALSDIVSSNRQLQADMMRQVPTLQDAALQPSQIQRDVGAGYEQMSQAEIDAARERFEFEQMAPRDTLRDAASMLSGINFGSVQKTTGGGK